MNLVQLWKHLGISRIILFYRGEYAWKDEKTNIVSKVTAHVYISNLMAYIQDKLENESIFPIDGNYNNTFNKIYNEISRRLVRLFHHFYD